MRFSGKRLAVVSAILMVVTSVNPVFAQVADASISGTAWDDVNSDGVLDASEVGLANVGLSLLDAGGSSVATTTTAPDGSYSFAALVAGSYTVDVDESSLAQGSVLTSGIEPQAVVLSESQVVSGIDFGYNVMAPVFGSIAVSVFGDTDQNGLQGSDERGVDGVVIELSDSNGVVGSFTTSGVAPLSFAGLLAGTYTVSVASVPGGYAATTATPLTVTLASGENLAIEFGVGIPELIETGLVQTLAGTGGIGWVDGDAATAQFQWPRGVVFLDGLLFVADRTAIRVIDPTTGDTSTLAGTDEDVRLDAPVGADARFRRARAISTDGSLLYVADSGRVRSIDPATGETVTLATVPAARGVVMAADGRLWVSADESVWRVDPADGAVEEILAFGAGRKAYAIDTDGVDIWVTVRESGVGFAEVWKIPLADHAAAALWAQMPSGSQYSLLSDGPYLYGMSGQDRVRRWDKSDASWVDLAGAGSGYADGTGVDAWFDRIWGLTIDDNGTLYVADYFNRRIRTIVPATSAAVQQPVQLSETVDVDPGEVSLLAGSGTPGLADGEGSAANFIRPLDVVWDGGFVYVADQTAIRKVDPVSGLVTTLVGTTESALVDSPIGADVRLKSATGISSDGEYLYVTGSGRVRRVSLTTGATSTVATIPLVRDVVVGPDGYLYVAADTGVSRVDPVTGMFDEVIDTGKNTYEITADDTDLWVTSRTVGEPADIWRIPVANPSAGSVWVVSANNSHLLLESSGAYLYGASGGNKIRRWDKADGSFVEIAGGSTGNTDGTGTAAQFSQIRGLATDGVGTLFAVEQGNYQVRKIIKPVLLTGSISGVVFDDANSNGTNDAEAGIGGVDVLVSGGSTVTTAADGTFDKQGLVPGNYTIDIDQATLPPNVTLTTASLPLPATVVGGNNTSVEIGYGPVPGSISGTVFDDANSNGSNDTEDGTAGVDITLSDGTGLLSTATTDPNGDYSFTTLIPGSYSVDVDAGTLPPDVVLTTTPLPIDVTVSSGAVATLDIGYGPAPGSITGLVFNDADANGTLDAGETFAQGLTVTLAAPGPDGLLGTGDDIQIGSTVTNGTGVYTFSAINVGDYLVDVVVPSGSVATTSNPIQVQVTAGTVATVPDVGIDQMQQTTIDIDPALVSLVAGDGTAQRVDGIGVGASFNAPRGVVVVDGILYVAEDRAIRRVDPVSGVVTTITTNNRVYRALASDGVDLYATYTASGTGQLWRIDPATGVETLVLQQSGAITDVTFAPDGLLYLTARWDVLWFDPVAGTSGVWWTSPSSQLSAITADDTDVWVTLGAETWRVPLSNPIGAVVFNNQSPYMLESAGDYLYGTGGPYQIRRWSKSDGTWVNIAGTQEWGYVNSVGTDARLENFYGLASDGVDGLFVADSDNNRVRRIVDADPLPSSQLPSATFTIDVDPGATSLSAGNGVQQRVDGVGPAASFNQPRGIVVVEGIVFVSEQNAVRRFDPVSGVVTTILETNRDYLSLASDGYYLYGTDFTSGVGSVWRIERDTGLESQILSFGSSVGDVVFGPDGFLYVATTWAIWRIDPINETAAMWWTSPGGVVTALAIDDSDVWVGADSAIWRIPLDDTASASRFWDVGAPPVLESVGEYLYGEWGPLRRWSKADGTWIDVAGTAQPGYLEGIGIDVRFGSVIGLASDGVDSLFMSDWGFGRIRRISDAAYFADGYQNFGIDGYGAWNGGINAGLGSYVKTYSDLSVATVGPTLEISRSYNSLDPREGAFGRGWTFNYGMTWNRDAVGNVAVLFPDGRRELHTKQTDGTFTPPDGYFSELVSDGNGGYTLTMKDRTVYTFGSDHTLASVVDANGEELTFSYVNDQLSTVTDTSSGRALQLVWNGDRLVEASTDPVSGTPITWKYYYDSNDQLVEACDPRDNTQTTGNCTSYTYDGGGLLLTITKPEGNTEVVLTYDPEGLVATRTDGDNNTWSFDRSVAFEATTTDPRGNTTRQLFDLKFRMIEEYDAAGNRSLYGYDSEGNRNFVEDGLGQQSGMTYLDGNLIAETNGELETTYYEFDSQDNLLTTRDGRSASASDNTFATTYTYDTAGNRLTQTDPLGNVFSWAYSDGTESAVGGGTIPAGLLLSMISPRGNEAGATAADYTTTYGYLSSGDLALTSPPSGLATTYTYDEIGRQVSETVTDSIAGTVATTSSQYDEVGNPTVLTEPAVVNPVSGVTHRKQVLRVYDKNGRVTSETVTDTVGGDPSRSSTFEYDGVDREIRVTDAIGGVLSRTYDSIGNVITVTDQEGRIIQTTYDPRNLPMTVMMTNFDDPTDAASPAILVLNTKTYDAAGRVVTSTDAEGRVTRLTYDAADRVVKTELVGFLERDGSLRDVTLADVQYDDIGNPTVQTRGSAGFGSLTKTIVYDNAGRPVTATLDPGGVNRVTTITFDADGRPLVTTVSEAGRVEETRVAYDTSGRPISQTVENGATDITTSTTYDERGNAITSTDSNGNVTTNVFDVLGRAVTSTSTVVQIDGGPATGQAVIQVGYNTFGDAADAVDANGNVTQTVYDLLGRLTTVNHPSYVRPSDGVTLNPVESFTYDAVGNKISDTSRRGETTTYLFDSLNRAVRQTDPQIGADPGGVTSRSYDSVGNVIETVDQEGRRTTTVFDMLNRERSTTSYNAAQSFTTTVDYDDLGYPTLVINPDGTQRSMVINSVGDALSSTDETGAATTVEYVMGRPTKSTDALGRYGTSEYDLAGRLTASRSFDAGDVLLTRTGFVYDANGNQTQVVAPEGYVSGDVPGYTTTMVYDGMNRLVSVSKPVDAVTAILTSYGYDLAGNMTRLVDGDANATTYAYNSWNLRETIVEPATAAYPALVDRSYVTSYDAGGLPVQDAMPGGVNVSRVFDELGRLTVLSGTGDGAASSTYSYDLSGLRTGVSHPNGQIGFSYDGRGLLDAVSGPAGAASYVYDNRGRLVQRVDAAGTHVFGWTDRSELEVLTDGVSDVTFSYVWDVASQVDTVTTDSGIVRNYDFDGLGRLVSDTLTGNGGAQMAAFTYVYDANSNVTSKDVSLPGNAMSGVHTYQYDFSDRLTSWTDPSTVVTGYTWDGRGNRLSAGLDVYTYDARNRISSGPDGAYSYTARGTLSLVDDGVQADVYDFDSLGRLTSFDDGVSTVSYVYDGLGRVASRNGSPFTYSGFSLDPVSDGTFTYGRSPAGRLISQTDGVTSLLAGLDRHGDLSFLFTASGVVSDTAVFDPFGDAVAETGSTDPMLGFQADFTDPVSGQVWMGARWYDGGWAAFLSRDTVFGELGSPVSLNRYTYANNNPLSYWDPDGRKGLRIDGVLHVGGDAGVFRKRFSDVFQVNTAPQTAVSVTVKASYAEKLQAIQVVPVRKQIPVDSGLVEAPLTWDTMTGPQQFQWLDSVQPALPDGGIAAAIRDVAKDLWQQNLECPVIGLAYGGENFCTGFEQLSVGGQSLVGTILTAAPPAAAAGGICILAGIVGCVTAAATTSGGPSIADNAADFTTPNTPPPATNGADGVGAAGTRATVHGSERLSQAGFTDDLVAQTKSALRTTQADGAAVYVREVSPGRFDFIVEGERGVITAYRGWSQKAIDRLAANYGWEGWPP